MKSALAVAILLGLFCHRVEAQDWELRKDEEGIKVYTMTNPNGGFDSFRAIMDLSLTVDEMWDFLKNMDKHPNAFPDTREIRILSRPNDSTQIQYTHTSAPWPVSDRDGIYELVFHKNEKTGALKTVARALPDYLPRKEDIVRIETSNTYWLVTPLSNGKSRIEYVVHADPGGSIPEWLANSAAVDVPYETFENIRKAFSN